MPLARARCPSCTQPLDDPPHVQVPLQCSACGTRCTLPFGADGHPVGFDASFTPGRFAKWVAAAKHAMASGMPGVAVGACPKCDSPLVVSSKTPVTLPCPHCQKPVEGPADQVLADQWPEPWCKIEGGQIEMEYRLAWNDEASGVVGGCPACAAPADPDDPTGRCRRCGAVTWIERDGKKMQLAVRVDGTRQTRPAKATMPLAQGEAALRADNMMGASADSGSSLLGVTGIGCAIAFAVTVLFIVVIIVVAKMN